MTQLLVVDDEPQFRNTLLKALKSQGYRATGIEGPDLLTSTLAIQRPDVVLLDLSFDSGADGLEACSRLRQWNSVPVIIISVFDDEATKVKALTAGAADYLVKTIGILELAARIEAIPRPLLTPRSAQGPVLPIPRLTGHLHTPSVFLFGYTGGL